MLNGLSDLVPLINVIIVEYRTLLSSHAYHIINTFLLNFTYHSRISISLTRTFSFSILFDFQPVEKAKRPRNCCCHCCCCSNWRRPPFCHWCSVSWHWLHSRRWLSANWHSCCLASLAWRNCSNRRIHHRTTKSLPIHTVRSMNMPTMDDPWTMHTIWHTLHTNSNTFFFQPHTSIEFTNYKQINRKQTERKTNQIFTFKSNAPEAEMIPRNRCARAQLNLIMKTTRQTLIYWIKIVLEVYFTIYHNIYWINS